ncbi:RNA polymerase sigma factor [Mucilaginibacter flavidus]|uniref:RNA polymerase sigma factor n=1 Tax=Mucilaginibacter flavidus TaxID=2949309 RepID=UPI0020935D34|nr:RNA polymerase sigma factor [Mucilaginibacter flavidus]
MHPLHYSVATMNPEQEKELIQQCRASPAAFGQVFDIWYKPVFGYILRRTADYDLSKDIAAETFLKAFLKINTFQWRGISLSAWLYRIATNELNQYYRSSKYKPQSLQQLLENPQMEKLLHQQDADEREAMEKEMQGFNDFNLIRTNLLKLDIKYQEVIALRYFEQKTNTEISAILDKNEGTIKSLLSRGLEKLRNML